MESEIKQIDVNPLRRKLTLVDMKLRHFHKGEEATLIKADQVEIEPNMIMLLSNKTFVIDNLAIYGLEVTTQRKKGEGVDALNKLGGEGRGLIFKKAIVKDARLKYTEFNVPPYIKGIYELDRCPFYVNDINISYDNGDFSMQGVMGNSEGKFEISGELLFSKDGVKFSGNSKISDFYIPYAWVYYERSFPAGISSGKLDMVSKFYIRNGMIEGANSVRINDLGLYAKPPGDNIFGLPPEEVINYLKDEKGRVDFDFTIQGSLNDPKFSLSKEFQAAIEYATIRSITERIKKIRRVIDILRGKVPQGDAQQAPSKLDKIKGIFELLKGKE